MKLEIESWLSEKQYSLNIRKLFSESVICYRNGAYRASLIFSYIGFLTIVKEILIRSQRPAVFKESEWDAIIKNLNNDDLWEKEVYEALIRSKKPIFPLSEDLRLQLKYWKDRRNDCAHFKRNEIESHHTESFWSFIKSNVPKITVEGGEESLLNRFDEHFDDTKTPPNKDYSHLIVEISTSVPIESIENFLDRLKRRIDDRLWWYTDSHALNVYSKILDIAEPEIQEALINFLKKENRDISFIAAHPEQINRLNYSEKEIRKLWKTRLANKSFGINPLKIYSGLLKSKLIPSDQIEEANECLFNFFSQKDYHFLPESTDIDTLKSNGFFKSIFKIAIQQKDLKKFLWVNSKCDLIISFIENEKLTVETVNSICKMGLSSNPSQWLIRELANTFTNMPGKKSEFNSIAKTNGIKTPLDLK